MSIVSSILTISLVSCTLTIYLVIILKIPIVSCILRIPLLSRISMISLVHMSKISLFSCIFMYLNDIHCSMFFKDIPSVLYFNVIPCFMYLNDIPCFEYFLENCSLVNKKTKFHFDSTDFHGSIKYKRWPTNEAQNFKIMADLGATSRGVRSRWRQIPGRLSLYKYRRN